MMKALAKPRWLGWESRCLKLAVEQKIQLKIIAAALEKSVTSISKKIKALGLRGERAISGRRKGGSYKTDWEEKIPRDVERMKGIMENYAPLRYSEKMKMVWQRNQWGSFLQSSTTHDASITHRQQTNTSFTTSLSSPLLEEEGFRPLGILRNPGESLYVPLHDVEKWAMAKGFRPIKTVLQNHGIFYWKEGKYFSKAQVLVYLNGIRFEKRLKPLVVYEEDVSA